MAALSDAFYEAVERRIERLTLLVAAAAAIFACIRWNWRAAVGVAVGGVLSWLNFRWLDQGVGQILRTVAGSADLKRPASGWIFVRFFGRVLLIVLALYAILRVRCLPGKALLFGFFSLICAVLLEVSYEVATGFREPNSRR